MKGPNKFLGGHGPILAPPLETPLVEGTHNTTGHSIVSMVWPCKKLVEHMHLGVPLTSKVNYLS